MKTRPNFVFSVLATLLLSLLTAKAQQYDFSSKVPLDPKVKTGVLDNGMTYFIRSNKLPEKRAEFYIAHNVGAILEDDDQNGLAHFTEHMAFNGTQNFPKKALLDYLATIGVKFGQNVNAYTSVEQTVYNVSSVPLIREGILDSALLILHDWSNYISFEPNEVDLERGVIREEWRIYGSAYERMDIKLAPTIYKDSKYAKRNVIGDTAVINNFKYETIKNFYHKWYRPDLQALVIVGDFDAAVVEAKVKKLFNSIPAVQNPVPKETYPLPDNKEPLIGFASDPEAAYTDVSIYFKHEPVKDENKNLGYMRTRLVQRFINSMFGQRMNEITRKENPPFISSYCYYGGFTRVKDAFTGYAQARNNEATKALRALLTEMERMKKYGFLPSELERAKADILRGYESAYMDRDKRKNRDLVQANIGYFLTKTPNPGIEFEYEFAKNIIPGITLDEINQTAKNYVRDDNVVITVTGPEKAGITLPVEAEIKAVLASYQNAKIDPYVDNLAGKKFMEKEPIPGKVIKTTENRELGTTEWTLSNGIKVVLKPTDFKEDELQVLICSFGGQSLLKDSDFPSALYLNRVVREMGVGDFSRTDLNKMLAGKRVNIYPWCADDAQGFNANMSPKDLETGLQLINLYLTKPRWNETDYNTYMEKEKVNYSNLEAEPRKAFSDTLTVMLNNHSKRYRPINKNILNEVSFEKIKSIYTDRFKTPADFVITFVGKINMENVKPLIEKYVASLPAVKRNEKWKDDGVRPPEGKITNDFVHENKTPRTSIYINYNGVVKYSAKEMLLMSALRHILELRYIDAIREEKGGSYHVGVSASIREFRRDAFNINISFDTDPKLADDLKAVVYKEIQKIIDNGPTEVDLQKAKEFFLKQRQEDLKENNWWCNYVLDEYYYHNNDVFKGFEEDVKNLTVKSVQDFAKKILTQGNIVEVIMRPK